VNANLYRLLDRPAVYALVQHLLAPGAERIITRRISDTLAAVPDGEPLLDLGCGPTSWLFRVGLRPFGLDLNPAYVAAYRNLGSPCVVASAVQIPFRDDSFGGVWSVGLLHHLPDELVKEILHEAIRVSHGYVAILDAVTPAVRWTRPLASLIRKLDRGKFMRSEQALKALLPGREKWTCQRFTYAATGLEMLSCVYQNNQA
jgi:ubiquinone/menaquinone biosynthesis C-methylase UbiE